MAQYKVPQDVEADDKLIGPFSFRQFVYLLVAAGLIALCVFLFQNMPLLAIFPIPIILLLLALALPLKKDQPMETYLAALISYYLKPRTRLWTPGQRESTITITAPKIVETSRTRDISGEEATHRLSFLAEVVDSEGRSIQDLSSSNMRDDLAAEATNTEDIFDNHHFDNLDTVIKKDEDSRHEELVKEMRNAIEKNTLSQQVPQKVFKHSDTYVIPPQPAIATRQATSQLAQPQIILPQDRPRQTNLANNSQDLSVATVAKEANRIRKEEGETYISLH